MYTLAETLTLRSSTLDRSYKDLVLDLSNIDDIDPKRFFAETFVTKGMRDLQEAVFRRLEGSSVDGTFQLTQAMGGGKTHTMITVGLLAKHPEYRGSIPGLYETGFGESARVVAFTGRNSPRGGIGGFIASVLGKSDLISDRLAKGEALDQNDWLRVLQGPPTLIMLDELPPYFANKEGQGAGHVQVATYELSNLLNALNQDEVSNVALVISDLKSGWAEGSEAIKGIVDNFEKETKRSAKRFEPVRQNSNEIYEILRKRLFEDAETKEVAKAVAKEYADEIRKAAKHDLTQETPERIADGIQQSYPFHPSLRDLYATFKENPGFQQTRGLIRLMRAVVTSMYDPTHGWANSTKLVHPYDIDPNDGNVSAELSGVNDKLTNAISNDIASGGTAAAERIDAELDTNLASKLARLLYVSSLSQVKDSPRGLTSSDYMAFLAAPGHDLTQIKTNILPRLKENSWYLHVDNNGRLLYRNVENVSAKINSYRNQLEHETVRSLVAKKLHELFETDKKDVYQELHVLKPVDEIIPSRDKVSLVVYEPYTGGDIHPDLEKLYENTEFKNRLLFLTGDKLGMETVFGRARYLAAADIVIGEFKKDQIAPNDPQLQEAENQRDTALHGLTSAVASVFTKVYFPTKNGLFPANISLTFTNQAERSGEQQIRSLLIDKRKFAAEVNTDEFFKQLEQKLVGGERSSAKWTEVLRKAATNTSWLLHKPDALEQAKHTLLDRQHWQEEGNYIKTGPFPKPATDVVIREQNESSLAREGDASILLVVTPQRADKVFYAYGTDTVSPTSGLELKSPFQLKVGDEMKVAFVAFDSNGVHPTGTPRVWERSVKLLHEIDQQGDGYRIEFQPSPMTAEVKYTDDGSDPRDQGNLYTDYIIAKPKTIVQAFAIRGGVESEVKMISVPALGEQGYQIDENKPAKYTKNYKVEDTAASFDLLRRLEKFHAKVHGLEVLLQLESGAFAQFLTNEDVKISPEQLTKIMEQLQEVNEDGAPSQLSLKLENIHFPSGREFKDFAREQALEYQNKDVDQ